MSQFQIKNSGRERYTEGEDRYKNSDLWAYAFISAVPLFSSVGWDLTQILYTTPENLFWVQSMHKKSWVLSRFGADLQWLQWRTPNNGGEVGFFGLIFQTLFASLNWLQKSKLYK